MIMINEKLKFLRKKSGKTQEKISQKLNVAQSTYSMYESGDIVPDVMMLNEIAKLFNVPVSFLVDNDFQIENDNIVLKRIDDCDKNKVVIYSEDSQFIYNLKPNEIEIVKQYVELLKKSNK